MHTHAGDDPSLTVPNDHRQVLLQRCRISVMRHGVDRWTISVVSDGLHAVIHLQGGDMGVLRRLLAGCDELVYEDASSAALPSEVQGRLER